MLNNIELKNYIKLYKKNRELINENNEIYENYEYMLRMLMSNIYGDIGADYLEDVLYNSNNIPISIIFEKLNGLRKPNIE